MSMTLEDFEIEFNNASTFELKESILNELLESNLDLLDSDMREYKAQLNDFKESIEIEVDNRINEDIENKKYELFTCIESIDEYVKDHNYYVFIDDVANEYRFLGVNEISEELSEYINNIKPIVWIVSDNGIGTLKRKNVFDNNFSKFFKKLDLK